MKRRLADYLSLFPLLAFLAILALLPVAVLFAGALAADGVPGLVAALSDPLNQWAAENSLLQGGLSAAAALAAGYPVGVLLGRYAWPGRSVVRAVLVVPFLMPTIVMVVGVRDLFGSGSLLAAGYPAITALSSGLGGIVVVNTLFNVPLVALLTAVGVEGASTPLEEAVATLGASPSQRYLRVWGPRSWVGAASGAFLTFLFSAQAFAAPLILCGARCYTLEARVFSLVQTFSSPGEAALLAMAMVALLLLPAGAYLYLVSRLRAGGGGSEGRRPVPWRSPVHWPLLAAAAIVVATVASLLASILYRAATAAAPGGGPGSAWPELVGPGGTARIGLPLSEATVNSLAFAGAATGIAVLLVLLAGYHRPRRHGALLRAYLFLPLLVSPAVLAFALATFWRPLLGGESSVWILILLSQATLALPFSLQAVDVALSGVPSRYREVARTLGASPFRAYLEAEVPLVRRAVVTAGVLAFALGLGEFTSTYFLATPSFTTLPVALYHLEAARAYGPAEAVGGLLVVVSLAAFLLVGRGGGRALL